MKSKENKRYLYIAGCLIIMSIWLTVRLGELSAFALLRYALLIVLSYIAMICDINTKRIPNTLVLLMLAGWLLMGIPMLIIDTESGIRLLIDSLSGLLIGGGLFLIVYLVSKKGLGGGDVKFMAAVGLYLGFAKTVPAILYGTVLAAVTGLILVLIKKIKRKGSIPLAPFLFAGIMIAVFLP